MQLLESLILELENNTQLAITEKEWQAVSSNSKLELQAFIEKGFRKEFILQRQNYDSMYIAWERNNDTNPDLDIKGSIDLIPWAVSTSKWDGVLWEEGSYMTDFYPIELIGQDTCIGLFQGDKYVSYHTPGEIPQCLFLDVESYITLLSYTKGFHGWQECLVDLLTLEDEPDATLHIRTKLMMQYLPTLFDFNGETFIRLFNKLRKDKS